MKTQEIEAEMLLQELESVRCKVEELSALVRSYTKTLLSREHDVQSWMAATGIGKRCSHDA